MSSITRASTPLTHSLLGFPLLGTQRRYYHRLLFKDPYQITLKDAVVSEKSFNRFCRQVKSVKKFGRLTLDQVSVDGISVAEMAKQALEVMNHHQTLSEISIKRCNLGDTEALAIAEMMRRGGFKKLRLLSLKNNRISDEAAYQMVVEMTKRRYSHLTLDLSNNKIGQKGEDRMRAHLARVWRLNLLT